MAYNQKKPPQQTPTSNRFLACFGITSKTASKPGKKRNKTGGSESWFKLCTPKIKIIIIRSRRRKGSFDANKTVALKASQSIIKLEAAKIRQLKLNQALITQESNDQQKRSNDDREDLQSTRGNQSEEPPGQEQRPIPTVKECCEGNKVTKDSVLGVSMMVITLVIMTFWGHLYAIICMSAWLYCVPLLRMYKDGSRPNLMGSLKANIASKLYYKKKVMIEGVVQRRDHNGIGVS